MKNREESAVYGVPGTFGEIQRITKIVKEEEIKNRPDIEEYEKGFAYIEKPGSTIEQTRVYTQKVKQELSDAISL